MKKFVSKVKLTGAVALGCGAFEYISSTIVFNIVWNAGKLIAKWRWEEGCSGGIEYKSFALCRTESSKWLDMHKNT